MVRADDDNTDSTEATGDTNKKEREPGRLTPMPDWLMKWWIPFALAVILFLGSMFITSIWGSATFDEIMQALHDFPKRWPFHMRTPSREEIEVCLTITAAGFAFSAWQQRSHDNATSAKQARAAIERDDYWKRREHIYQLLGSKNPGLRLGAVALLAELADSAAHSSFRNKTEKQQLQRHIIDTLCLQIRHEGVGLKDEGNTSDRAQIQAAIFEIILKRIDIQRKGALCADWSKEPINITSCMIHAPILIQNLTTDTTIDFSHSKFLSTFELDNTTITTLLWERAHFIGELNTRNNSMIGIRSLPRVAPYCRYFNTSFVHKSETFIITLTSYENHTAKPATLLSDCKFISKLTKNASPIEIHTTHNESNGQNTAAQSLHIFLCQLRDVTINATYINSRIWIADNRITGRLQIILAETANQADLSERTPRASGRIQIQNNVIQPEENDEPIRITNYTDTDITTLLTLDNNHISRQDNFSRLHTLECKIDTNTPNPFRFLERRPGGQIVHTWQTGGGTEDSAYDLGPYLSSFFKED